MQIRLSALSIVGLSLMLAPTWMSGCGEGGGTTPTPDSGVSGDSPDSGTNRGDGGRTAELRQTIRGQVRGLGSSSGLPGVEVQGPASTMTVTDASGQYSLSVPTQSEGVEALEFFKDGWVSTCKRIPNEEGEVIIDVTMAPVGTTADISGMAGGTVTTTSGASISFTSGSFALGDGTSYTGTVSVEFTHVDPQDREQIEAFPGSFSATSEQGEEGLLISYSLADITARTADGDRLDLSSGSAATLQMPISNPDEAPDTIDLWSLNPETAEWVHEGTATKQQVDGQFVYVAEVTHFSWWNADRFASSFYVTPKYSINGTAATAAEVRTQFPNAKLKGFRANNAVVNDMSPPSGSFRAPVGVKTTLWVDAGNGTHRSQLETVLASSSSETVEVTFNITEIPQKEQDAGDATCATGQRPCNGGCLDVDVTCTTVHPDDICSVDNGNCREDQLCSVKNGVRRCSCAEGYTESSGACVDVDECATDNGGCDALTACTNQPGSRDCGPCPVGYTGTGTTSCQDIDECATDNGGCDALTDCTNTTGSFSCSDCPVGYTGTGTTSCQDIDECATDNGGCLETAGCENTPGSRTCSCPEGYAGDGVSSCDDVDECTAETDECHSVAICTNTEGSHTCACPDGYRGDATDSGTGCWRCSDLGDESSCFQNAECAWDLTESECIHVSEICGRNTFEEECTATGCRWDGSSCLDPCQSYMDEASCPQDCSWDDFFFMCMPNCAGAQDAISCESVNGCFWDGFGCSPF